MKSAMVNVVSFMIILFGGFLFWLAEQFFIPIIQDKIALYGFGFVIIGMVYGALEVYKHPELLKKYDSKESE